MAKTILITGASAGIGEETARRFALQGHRLVLLGRRRDRLAELAKGLSVPLHQLVVDVRDTSAVSQALAHLPDEFATIDVLVNSAGLALGTALAGAAKLEDWFTVVDTNIKGLLAVTHALLPGMIERRSGHIVNLGSVAGTYPYPGGNVYGASKAFVELFSLNLRADLLGHNIRVTNIEPGMVETEFSVVRYGGDQEKAKQVYAGMQPLSADDIAESISWAVNLPSHVNINRIELMPVAQAASGFAVHRAATDRA